MKPDIEPPLYTAVTDLTAWTLLRTADLPKSHRFTIGQRLDNLTLDALLLVTQQQHCVCDRAH